MKKILTISFLILYLTLSVGLNIIVHTCGGESEAILVAGEIKDPCICGNEMPMDDMCCSTELKTVKLDDSQKVSISNTEEVRIVITEAPMLHDALLQTESVLFVKPNDTSPPPKKDLQISNSVFRI